MCMSTIESQRLVLRPFTREDAAKASENSRQPIMAHWLSDMVLENEERAAGWIDWINERCRKNKSIRVFAIERKSDKRLIGLMGYAPKAELNDEIEILYGIADPYQGAGYATEAARALIWYAFEDQGLDSLSAIVKPDNAASVRIIEKMGFVYGDTRLLPYDGKLTEFHYYRMYPIEYLGDPLWSGRVEAEEMSGFFNARAEGYDSHMLSNVCDREAYRLGVSPLPETQEELSLLDFGCGTGIELEFMFERAPLLRATCVDMSEKMLDKLKEKYPDKKKQIHTVNASYLNWEFPKEAYDYVFSSFTLHHFTEEVKAGIYKNILEALKPGGIYIESDFIVDKFMMEQYLRRYERIVKNIGEKVHNGYYHIDIPLTVERQEKLLLEAGFAQMTVVYDGVKPRGSHVVLTARK